MKKKGFSTPSIFGGMNHYDEHGKKIGYSAPRLFGGVNHYDKDGHKIGSSQRGILGGMSHYDEDGDQIGHSYPGILGGTHHYNEDGEKVGYSHRGVLAGVNHYDTDGVMDGDGLYEEDFGLFTGRTDLDTFADNFRNGVPDTMSDFEDGPDSTGVSRADLIREAEMAAVKMFPARAKMQAEQRAIDQYLNAFGRILPYRRTPMRYDWRNNQVVMDTMAAVLAESESHYHSAEFSRVLAGLPYRMTAYNTYSATDEAANLIIDELFFVIDGMGRDSDESLLALTDACRFYIYEMEHLVKKNHQEARYLMYFLDGELCIREGNFAGAVMCYHQILGWDKLLKSTAILREDWPCDEPALIYGTEDFYEAVFINLVNVYALLKLPECTDHMRKLFVGIYSWLHGVYGRMNPNGEVRKLDVTSECRGFNLYDYNFKDVLERMDRRRELKNAKRVRLFRQNLKNSDGITAIYMEHVSAFIMPDICVWDEEKHSLYLNGFYKIYDPAELQRQSELLKDAFEWAKGQAGSF